MKSLKRFFFLAACFLFLAACAGGTTLPSEKPFLPSSLDSEVYVGEGMAYSWRDGTWVEAPAYSYEFMVVKRLYDGRWTTVKQLYRLHPDYSGIAGPRQQTLFFNVRYHSDGDGYAFEVEGTLGQGVGETNKDMSVSSVELTPEGSGLLRPFNRIRINQRIDRVSGMMSETVELLKLNDDGERPFMKFEEHGTVYLSPQPRQPADML